MTRFSEFTKKDLSRFALIILVMIPIADVLLPQFLIHYEMTHALAGQSGLVIALLASGTPFFLLFVGLPYLYLEDHPRDENAFWRTRPIPSHLFLTTKTIAISLTISFFVSLGYAVQYEIPTHSWTLGISIMVVVFWCCGLTTACASVLCSMIRSHALYLLTVVTIAVVTLYATWMYSLISQIQVFKHVPFHGAEEHSYVPLVLFVAGGSAVFVWAMKRTISAYQGVSRGQVVSELLGILCGAFFMHGVYGMIPSSNPRMEEFDFKVSTTLPTDQSTVNTVYVDGPQDTLIRMNDGSCTAISGPDADRKFDFSKDRDPIGDLALQLTHTIARPGNGSSVNQQLSSLGVLRIIDDSHTVSSGEQMSPHRISGTFNIFSFRPAFVIDTNDQPKYFKGSIFTSPSKNGLQNAVIEVTQPTLLKLFFSHPFNRPLKFPEFSSIFSKHNETLIIISVSVDQSGTATLTPLDTDYSLTEAFTPQHIWTANTSDRVSDESTDDGTNTTRRFYLGVEITYRGDVTKTFTQPLQLLAQSNQDKNQAS